MPLFSQKTQKQRSKPKIQRRNSGETEAFSVHMQKNEKGENFVKEEDTHKAGGSEKSLTKQPHNEKKS